MQSVYLITSTCHRTRLHCADELFKFYYYPHEKCWFSLWISTSYAHLQQHKSQLVELLRICQWYVMVHLRHKKIYTSSENTPWWHFKHHQTTCQIHLWKQHNYAFLNTLRTREFRHDGRHHYMNMDLDLKYNYIWQVRCQPLQRIRHRL